MLRRTGLAKIKCSRSFSQARFSASASSISAISTVLSARSHGIMMATLVLIHFNFFCSLARLRFLRHDRPFRQLNLPFVALPPAADTVPRRWPQTATAASGVPYTSGKLAWQSSQRAPNLLCPGTLVT